MFGFSLFQSQI